MANYCCAVRTNYFRVKNEDKFRDLISRAYGYEDDVRLWERDRNGKTVFAFGAYSGIAGLRSAQEDENDDTDESSFDEFINGLQDCVADNDAIIIFESGNEKLRYIVGAATVITSKGYEHMDICDLAVFRAANMLENLNWNTECSY